MGMVVTMVRMMKESGGDCENDGKSGDENNGDGIGACGDGNDDAERW